MNYIEVIGGNKFLRDIAEKTVMRMIKEMMPRMRTLEIEVQIKKLKGDVAGWCMMEDTNRQFTLEISNELTLRDFITTVCHEMVHVKQYARNEMNGDGIRWKKGKVKEGTGYYDLPWEKEAYRLQDKLAMIMWEEDIL